MADEATDDQITDAPAEAPPTKTFTEDDVTRIVQERLARERQKFADYDEAKAKAAQFDELDAANKSELERALERATTAEEQAAAAMKAANERLVRAEIVTQASLANAVDPDAVFALLDKDAVTVADDGQVTGAEAAVKALLESKPFLVGNTPATGTSNPSADGGPQGTGTSKPRQLTQADLAQMSPAEIVKAQDDGLLDDLLGGA